MSVGINHVELMGHLGSDPNFRKKDDFSVANVTIATGSAYKDKTTGEWVQRTEWHRVVFFGRQAETVNEYLKKGSKILIKGSLRTRKWQDKNTHEDRYTVEIMVREFFMLSGQANKDRSDDSPFKPKEDGAARTENQAEYSQEFQDDIPF